MADQTILAFIGLGAMGRPMARRLLGAPNTVVRGFDLNPAALADLAHAGGIPRQTAASAADGAEALLLMVVKADQAEQAKLGLPLSALARQMFLQASGMGLGRADDSQVIAVYKRGEG